MHRWSISTSAKDDSSASCFVYNKTQAKTAQLVQGSEFGIRSFANSFNASWELRNVTVALSCLFVSISVAHWMGSVALKEERLYLSDGFAISYLLNDQRGLVGSIEQDESSEEKRGSHGSHGQKRK